MVRKKVTLKKDKNGVKSVFFLGNWAPNVFWFHVWIYSNKRCANFVFRQLFEIMAKKPLFPSKTPKKTSFSVINRKGSLNRKKIIRSILRKMQFWRLKLKFLSCGSSSLVTIGKRKSEKLKIAVFLKKYYGGEFFFFFYFFCLNGVRILVKAFIFHMLVSVFNFSKFLSSRIQSFVKIGFGAAFFQPSNFEKKKNCFVKWTPRYAHTKFQPPSSHRAFRNLGIVTLQNSLIILTGTWLTLHIPGFYCLTGLASLARIRGAGRVGTLYRAP